MPPLKRVIAFPATIASTNRCGVISGRPRGPYTVKNRTMRIGMP
jgi:hypothetical protein